MIPAHGSSRKSAFNLLRADDSPYTGFKSFACSAGVALWLLVIGIAPVLPTSTLAQTSADVVLTDQRPYAIAPGKLSDILAEFAATAGVQLVFEPKLLAGMNSDGLRGRYSVQEGFDILLQESGFRFRFVDASTVTLVRAPDNDIDDTLRLAPIMVQGELQTRTLQDTQTSVAVIRGEELESRSNGSLFDIAERTANVASSGAFGQISIRGILNDGFGGGNGSLIQTRIDGAPINGGRIAGLSFDSTWDLEQIEILRGPQSTQSGRNALAGAVDIRSKDPTYEEELKIRTELGNASTFGGTLAANVPLIEDTLAMRLSLDHQKTDGFVKNPTLGIDDFGESDTTTLRAGLRLDPAKSLSAVLKYTQLRGEGALQSAPVDGSRFPDQRVTFGNVRNTEEVESDSVNLRLSYDLDDTLRLESETVYFKGDLSGIGDSDNSPADIGVSIIDQGNENLIQELKLVYESNRVNAVLGGFYERAERNSDGIFRVSAVLFSGSPLDTVDAVTTDDNESVNYAAFAEVEYRMLPDVAVIVGGRYDRESREVSDSQFLVSTDPTLTLPPNISTESDKTFDAWLPKLGIVYDFTDNASLGFTVQRGYRAGGSGRNFVTGKQFKFDPEFTRNYEVSFRSKWADDRVTLNANVYYTDWTDQQIRVPGASSSGFDFTIENAGESRLFGGEIEAEALVSNNLELFVSIGYTDTKFEDFISGGVQLAGNEFPLAPELTIALGGTYYFRDGFFFSADASYQDDTFSDVQNTEDNKTDSRFLANARLGYETDEWSVLAYVDNMFDKDYVTRSNSGIVNVGDPMTFGVIGQVRF